MKGNGGRGGRGRGGVVVADWPTDSRNRKLPCYKSRLKKYCAVLCYAVQCRNCNCIRLLYPQHTLIFWAPVPEKECLCEEEFSCPANYPSYSTATCVISVQHSKRLESVCLLFFSLFHVITMWLFFAVHIRIVILVTYTLMIPYVSMKQIDPILVVWAHTYMYIAAGPSGWMNSPMKIRDAYIDWNYFTRDF